MKIAVAGTGYVGMSIATLLAQHNRVVAVDIIQEKVVSAVNKYLDDLGLAAPLNVTQLYGAVYASDPEIAKTFVVSDIQVNMPGASGVVRDLVPCAWNEKLTAMPGVGVSVRFI